LLKKKPFLVVSPAYPPPLIGGSIVYIYSLLENSYLKFDILTSENATLESDKKYSRHNVFRKRWIHFSAESPKILLIRSYFYQLFWIIMHRKKYEFILANSEVIQNSLIIIVGNLIGIKVIPLSYAEELTVPLYNNKIKSNFKKFLLKRFYPKAYRHISCCHFAKDILKNNFMIKDELINLIPVPFNSKKIKLKNKNNKLKSGYKLLSVGRLVKRKGFAELINVVKIMKVNFPLLELNIVGTGPLENYLKKKVLDEDLGSYVTIHGKVSDEFLNELYIKSDIFILAHRMLDNGDTEGSPTTFAEAGFYKLPSIGGINSGASTIIDDKKTGFIIDMKNEEKIISTIKNLLNNQLLIKKMGDTAYKKIINEHNPKIIGAHFSIILQNMK